MNDLPEDDNENNNDSMSKSESEENTSEIIKFRDGTLMRKRIDKRFCVTTRYQNMKKRALQTAVNVVHIIEK